VDTSARKSVAAQVSRSEERVERPVDRRRTNMRERVEQAATELFFEHGFEATSVRMIADACGITPGALYNHFATKEELLFDIVQGASRLGQAMMHEGLATAASDPASQLRAATAGFVLFYARHRRLGLIASSEYTSLPEPWLSQIKQSRIEARATFEKLIAAGQRSGDFRLLQVKGISPVRLASIAIGDACIRVAEWFDPQGSLSDEKVAELYAELSLRLVGAGGRSGDDAKRVAGRPVAQAKAQGRASAQPPVRTSGPVAANEQAERATDEPVDGRRTNMRSQIEQEAAKLFFQHGFEATSIRMIADACGITHGALYSFATKEDILFEAIQKAIAQTETMMAEAMARAAPDPRSQFVAAVTALVQFHAAHRLTSLLASSEYTSLPEPRLSQVKAERIRIRSVFEKIILAGQRSGQFQLVQTRGMPAVRLASIALGDMCIRVAEWFNPERSVSPEKMGELYAELGLRLVGAVPTPRE
jgi:AcrR family transcriptional regulator